jgi:hypothetical protein
MSAFNLFRPVTATVQVAPPLSQQNPGAEVVPPAGSSNPTPQEPANPLDAHAQVWQNNTQAGTKPVDLSQPLFNTDSAKIAEAAGKLDFASSIPTDLMQRAMSDPAVFSQVLNSVAQRAVATATQIQAATTEQAAQRNNERLMAVLPDRIRQVQLDGLQPDNPALQHPAAQPLLKMVRTQLQANNPGMPAAEISRRAEAYLVGVSAAVSQPDVATVAAQQAQTAGTDWDKWLS